MKKMERCVGRLLVVLVAVAWALAVAGPAASQGLANSSWPKKHHDLRNTGQATVNGPVSPNPETLWVFQHKSAFRTSPTVGEDGKIYVVVAKRPMCVIDPTILEPDDDGDGFPQPHLEACTGGGGAARHSSPTVASDGTVYFGARDNKLWAVDPTSQIDVGDPENVLDSYWTYKINRDGDIPTTPAVDPSDGSIIFGCGCVGVGEIFVIDPSTKAFGNEYSGNTADEEWREHVQAGILRPSPAVNDIMGNPNYGAIYAVTTKGILHRFDQTPGGDGLHQVWTTFSLGISGRNSTESAPVIGDDGTIYMATRSKGLFAISDDGVSPTQVWTTTANIGKIETTPALSNSGILYVADRDGRLWAIDSSNGNALTTGYPVHLGFHERGAGSPIIGADGTVYVPMRKSIFAVKPADAAVDPGKVLWSRKIKKKIKGASPALMADGTLLVPERGRRLWAFRDP